MATMKKIEEEEATDDILDDEQREEIKKVALIAYSLYGKYNINVNVINVLDTFPKQLFHNKTPKLKKEAKDHNQKIIPSYKVTFQAFSEKPMTKILMLISTHI